MVALLRHQPTGRRSEDGPAPLRLVPDRRVAEDGPRGRPSGHVSSAAGERPRLELVPVVDDAGGPSPLVVAAVALVVFGLLGLVRVAQSPGPVEADRGVGPAIVAEGDQIIAAEGDQIIVARAGDSLWSIATTLAPDEDPRPVVAALIAANGGESVQIGQQIVIPSTVLD